MPSEAIRKNVDSRLSDLVELLLSTLKAHDVQMFEFATSIVQFRILLTEESDRGCALMAASYIEEQLKTLIAAYLLDDSKLRDKILTKRGPLSTFSARTDMAYGMGLISREAYLDLSLLRGIRNDFAHTSEPLSFDTERIAARCRTLRKHVGAAITSPRQQFTRAMHALVTEIYMSKRKAVPAGSPASTSKPESTLRQVRELSRALSATGWTDNPFAHI